MKAKILSILVLALVLAVPTIANAQMRANTIHISPMAGGIFLDSKLDTKNGGNYGVGLGYNFTENWGIEVMGSYAPGLDHKGDLKGDSDITNVRLNALYHISTGTNFTPYVTAGGGGFFAKSDDRDNYNSGAINGGLGFKYFFNDTVAARVEATDVYSFKDSGTNNATVMAGLTFQFGGDTECNDEDNDGVCDEFDKCPGTPAGYRIDADGCPLTVSISMDVKFDFDKDLVKEAYLPEVSKVANFMQSHPASSTTVEGHTDSVGADDYNQKLSQRRANAVRDTLVHKFGVESSRLNSIGYGEARPVADNETAAGRAQNRRVVGVVSGAEVSDAEYDQNK